MLIGRNFISSWCLWYKRCGTRSWGQSWRAFKLTKNAPSWPFLPPASACAAVRWIRLEIWAGWISISLISVLGFLVWFRFFVVVFVGLWFLFFFFSLGYFSGLLCSWIWDSLCERCKGEGGKWVSGGGKCCLEQLLDLCPEMLNLWPMVAWPEVLIFWKSGTFLTQTPASLEKLHYLFGFARR